MNFIHLLKPDLFLLALWTFRKANQSMTEGRFIRTLHMVNYRE